MTSEEKRRTSYQNGHGKSHHSDLLFSVMDVFILISSAFQRISFSKKTESNIITFHIYGSDDLKGLLGLILTDFLISLEQLIMFVLHISFVRAPIWCESARFYFLQHIFTSRQGSDEEREFL